MQHWLTALISFSRLVLRRLFPPMSAQSPQSSPSEALFQGPLGVKCHGNILRTVVENSGPSQRLLEGLPHTIPQLRRSGLDSPHLALPLYQFMQPSVAVSPFAAPLLDFFDSSSVRLLQEQGPQNATRGDPDSSPGAPPNARAGDPTDPSPVARRPPRWLSTVTRLIRPN